MGKEMSVRSITLGADSRDEWGYSVVVREVSFRALMGWGVSGRVERRRR